MKQFHRFYRENFGTYTESDKPVFRTVNVHAHNGCNLACKGCNHNSSVLAPGSGILVDQMLDDLDSILPRLHIWSHIRIHVCIHIFECKHICDIFIKHMFWGER